jgi:hypothetical protein
MKLKNKAKLSRQCRKGTEEKNKMAENGRKRPKKAVNSLRNETKMAILKRKER